MHLFSTLLLYLICMANSVSRLHRVKTGFLFTLETESSDEILRIEGQNFWNTHTQVASAANSIRMVQWHMWRLSFNFVKVLHS